jgi:O-antigen/teichoic acid export membrane protein
MWRQLPTDARSNKIAMTEEPGFCSPNLLSLRRWSGAVGRVSWAFIDQAQLGLSNFAVNVFLARWLPPAEYGGYVTAAAVFWIALIIHAGLLADPLMVFGSGRFRDRSPAYSTVVLLLHCGMTAIIAATLAAIGTALLFCDDRTSGLSLLGFALSAPLVLLLPLLRRTIYLWSHPRLSAIASTIYLIGVVGLLYAFERSATLSPLTAPLAAAGASTLAITGIIAMRGFAWRASWGRHFVREVAVAHRRYGLWSTVTGIINWGQGGLYFLVVPMLLGLKANAALNVLWILVMPVIHLGWASSLLLVPAFSRARREGSVVSLIWIALLVSGVGASLYALIIGLFGGRLIDVLYVGRFAQYAHLAWLTGLLVFPEAAMAVFAPVLRAYERPDRELSANLAATAVACIGIAAIAAWGVRGALLGLLAGRTTCALVAFWWVTRTSAVAEPQAAATTTSG